MKLNDTQFNILKLMNARWELGRYRDWGLGSYHTTLQKGGLGKGGETIAVNMNTLRALDKRKLINTTDHLGHPTIYKLTALGKSVLKEMQK
jgi:hypothetical protein